MDFAEGTRLVRVVPDVPGRSGRAAPAGASGRPRAAAAPSRRRRSPTSDHDHGRSRRPPRELAAHDDAPVRDVHPGRRHAGDDRSIDALLDEVAEHDTVVLGRSGEDPEADDPRARIPAWEDIVFGVRRHR